MKIFTRCVYAWQPDGSLKLEESDSFDYEGPVALCKDSPSPPPAPDYNAIALQQGATNAETARLQARLNNPNFASRQGSRSVRWNPGDDTPTILDTLSPGGERIYNQGERTAEALTGIAEQGVGRVGSQMGSQFDMGQVRGRPGMPDAPGSSALPQVQPLQGVTQYGAQPQESQYGALPGQAQYGAQPLVSQFGAQPGTAQYGALPGQSQFGTAGPRESSATDVPMADEAGRQRVANALYQRAAQPMERQNELQTNAALIGGHNRGGAAMNAIADDQARARNDLALAAEAAGGAEQSRLFGLGAQTNQMTEGQKAMRFGQQADIAGLGDTREQARFAQGAQLAGMGDTRANTQFGQQSQLADRGDTRALAQFGQQAQIADRGDTRANTQFAQQAQIAGLGDTRANTRFGQQSQVADRGDARAQAQFAQAQAAGAQRFGQEQAAAQMGDAQNMNRFNAEAQLFGLGTQGRQQDIQEQAYLRSLPLNELNALRTGNAAQMPQFQQYAGGGQIQPAPIMQGSQLAYQAALGPYNQQMASNNSMTNGLFQLGGAALGGWLSDRRLKSKIARVGTHALGIGVYEYDIEGRRERGVMADEVLRVRPWAVSHGARGYMRVNYAALEG